MTPVDRFELVLGLLTAIVVLSALAPRLHIPPAAAFVLGGMLLAVLPGAPPLELDPDLVLVLFLPPLLQAAAFSTVWRDFRAQLGPIMLLAFGAVLLTTATVGWAAKLIVPSLPWAACFTLGAIVSPPDAVAAKAVLQTLRLPRRLVTILEGESLINDATGLVVYRFAVAAALSGAFSAAEAAGSFAWLSIGGVGIGMATGLLADALFRRMRDPNRVVIASFLMGWATYMLAEHLHASGVLAVVACGLWLGWRHHETLTAQVRLQTRTVWEVVVFVLEALVFVLIGLSLRGVLGRLEAQHEALSLALPLTLAVTGVVVLSRFALVYASVYGLRLLPGGRRADLPPSSIPLILSWAGMRGVVSLAAALALPAAFPGRDLILLATFGVILATVLVQGTTIGPLVRLLRVGAIVESETTLTTAATRARVMAATAAWLDAHPEAEAHPILRGDYQYRAGATGRLAADADRLQVQHDAHFAMALHAVAQGRIELLRLHRAGTIHDSVLDAIESELDHEELHLRTLAGLAEGGAAGGH